MERLFLKLALLGFGLVCLVEFLHMPITASLLDTQLTGKETIVNLVFFFLSFIFVSVGASLKLKTGNSNEGDQNEKA